MLKPERLALELLEYKLDDLKAGRKSSSERNTSVWKLRDHLMGHLQALDPDERNRLNAAVQLLKTFSERSAQPQAPQATLDFNFNELVLDTDEPPITTVSGAVLVAPTMNLSAAEQEEQAILKRLARRVWWFEVERVVQRLAATCRAERDRHTARIIYTFTRNLAAYAKEPAFSEDIALQHFKVKEAVPELADPLISLNNIESISGLIQEVIELALSLKQSGSPYEKLQLPEHESLNYLRRMALAVARDPYAGKLSVVAHKSMSSRQLQLAIEELNREPMREEQRHAERRRLEERLQAARAFERSQRQLFDKDVQAFRHAVDVFFDQLAVYLPERIGGRAGEPRLPGGVLFAENAALRIERVPRDAMFLTLRLKGPLRFKFAGLDLAIMGSGRALSLYVGDTERVLEPRLEIAVDRRRLLVFREDPYVHLRIQDESRSLATLVTEVLVVYHVLRSPHGDNLLELLKAATGVSAGEPQEAIRQALQRLSHFVLRAPQPAKAIQGFIIGAQRATKVNVPEDALDEFIKQLHLVTKAGASDLATLLDGVAGAKKGLYQLTDDPLSLDLGGQPITIRLYRSRDATQPDNVVVMMPGKPLGSFTDYLIQPLGMGTLMCIKAEEELAVFYFEEKIKDTLVP